MSYNFYNFQKLLKFNVCYFGMHIAYYISMNNSVVYHLFSAYAVNIGGRYEKIIDRK